MSDSEKLHVQNDKPQTSNKFTRIKERIRKTLRNYVRLKSKRCNTVIPLEHYVMLYRSSFMIITPVLFALYNGYYFLSLFPLGVFLTSINYWCYPVRCWRRNVDMLWVAFASIYLNIIAYKSEYGYLWYISFATAVLAYFASNIASKLSYQWTSTAFHSCVHLFGCVGQLFLYNGYIPYEVITITNLLG